jgi:CheY-like chemotaxis protein
MKKVLIAKPILDLIGNEKNFLQRTDIRVTAAETNDDLRVLCRASKPHLVISRLDMPGMDSVELFETLRDGGMLRNTAVIIIHAGRPGEAELAQQCSADAVFRMPVNKDQLLKQAQHLLDIPLRESYRVLLSVKVEGKNADKTFFCRSENISITGLLLETERALALKERIECSFFLPGSQQLVVRGEVSRQVGSSGRTDANLYGVQFLSLPPEAKTAIESFVAGKAKISSPSAR